jgi:hypothetical protein
MAAGDGPTPLAGPAGDRCQNCQAPLASDQRYCVNCGLRRGRSRYSLEAMAAQAAAATAPAPAGRRPIRSRVSTGVTMITGVATLLLAMGVGVLIGHDSSSSPPQKASAGFQVVTVGGGSGSPVAAGTPANKAKRSAKSSNAALAKKIGVKPTVVHLNKKTVQQAAQAATKVFGKQGNLAPPTIRLGQACAHGAGCQGGKFTGNFFH